MMEGADFDSISGDPDAIARLMNNPKYAQTYLIITRSGKAGVELLGELPPGSLERLEQTMTQSTEFKIVYANQDAKIFVLAEGTNGVRE